MFSYNAGNPQIQYQMGELMFDMARRYNRTALGVLCSLTVMLTVSAAPQWNEPTGWNADVRSAAEAARFLEYST